MTSRLVLFKKLLTPGKIGQTLCLGNLTDSATYTYLRSISPDLKLVRGRFDADAPSLPLSGVATHGSLKIGFLEGFSVVVPGEADALLAEARRLDVDVQGISLTLYVYQLKTDDKGAESVAVEKVTFTKKVEA
ncbi:hypothetical protein GMDG_02635 [Pseudogymnoascus destructans 20631-21]|uniref:Uncharacterized protein n=1 Tax=Pseudogymnoascus destructans (strain ATCC MYA-4855 / 20631-21) TaxID=658429 RepID=L8G3A5_PSED2|nr:hypothetical protein GMDG_02635 [Pseudogymnoascus destructans 20631-21]